jgi:hypothetical protein
MVSLPEVTWVVPSHFPGGPCVHLYQSTFLGTTEIESITFVTTNEELVHALATVMGNASS